MKLPNAYVRSYFVLALALINQNKLKEAQHYALLGLKISPNHKIGDKVLQRVRTAMEIQ